MRRLIFCFAAATVYAAGALAQSRIPEGWNDPFPPHHIMDNFYYVGTKELASFLIVTPAGNILMNSSYDSSVPIIRANVEKLGFKFSDIKILISGHAHPDHAEGDFRVKELTGAQVVVGRLEIPALMKLGPKGTTHPIDRMVDEGDTVSLGGTTLTAHVMPGHTKGCLAWTTDLKENGKSYHTLVECSLNGRFLKYIGNTDYPGIVDDMRTTYKRARSFNVDVFLSSHGEFYGLDKKYPKLVNRKEGDPNPFIDPEGYKAHVEEFEKSFEKTLADQQAKAAAAQ